MAGTENYARLGADDFEDVVAPLLFLPEAAGAGHPLGTESWPTAAIEWSYRYTPWKPQPPPGAPPPRRPRSGASKVSSCPSRCQSASGQRLKHAGAEHDGVVTMEDAPTRPPSREIQYSSSTDATPRTTTPDALFADLPVRALRPRSAPPATLRPVLEEDWRSSSPVGRQRPHTGVPSRRAPAALLLRPASADASMSGTGTSGSRGGLTLSTVEIGTVAFVRRLELAAEVCGYRARGTVTNRMRQLLQRRQKVMLKMRAVSAWRPRTASVVGPPSRESSTETLGHCAPIAEDEGAACPASASSAVPPPRSARPSSAPSASSRYCGSRPSSANSTLRAVRPASASSAIYGFRGKRPGSASSAGSAVRLVRPASASSASSGFGTSSGLGTRPATASSGSSGSAARVVSRRQAREQMVKAAAKKHAKQEPANSEPRTQSPGQQTAGRTPMPGQQPATLPDAALRVGGRRKPKAKPGSPFGVKPPRGAHKTYQQWLADNDLVDSPWKPHAVQRHHELTDTIPDGEIGATALISMKRARSSVRRESDGCSSDEDDDGGQRCSVVGPLKDRHDRMPERQFSALDRQVTGSSCWRQTTCSFYDRQSTGFGRQTTLDVPPLDRQWTMMRQSSVFSRQSTLQSEEDDQVKLKSSKKSGKRAFMNYKTSKGNEDVGLSSLFSSTSTKAKAASARQGESKDEQWSTAKLAWEMDLTAEEVTLVRSHFEGMDEDGNGKLSHQEFEKAMVQIIQERNESVQPEAVRMLCRKHFDDCDQNADGEVDFPEFLKWYSDNKYKEDVLLGPEERSLRDLSRKFKITFQDIEMIKRVFDSQDADGNGTVGADEFKVILYKVLKVPPGVELPPSRIELFWAEVDQDKSGEVTFEEFLSWWVSRSEHLQPYEDYYWRIRPVGGQKQLEAVNARSLALRRGKTGRAPGVSGPLDPNLDRRNSGNLAPQAK